MQHSARTAHEQARWMRHDAARWIRVDAARFLKPGARIEDVFPALALKYNPNQPRVPAGHMGGGQWTSGAGGRPRVITGTTDLGGDGAGDDPAAFDDSSDIDGAEFDPASGEIGDSALDDIFSDHDRASIYDPPPSQAAIIDDNRVISDADPDPVKPGEQYAQVGSDIKDGEGLPYYARGGHHEMPNSVYKKWDLQPETRKVFNDSTTGSLPRGRTIETPDGPIRGHYWDGKGGLHDEYNKAVDRLGQRFMDERGITPRQMTPQQAKDLLIELRNTEDPTIRNYNQGIRLLRRFYRIFRGRE